MKQEANTYIMSFMKSPNVWQITVQLLENSQQMSHHMIGATALYQKLDTDFISIESSDS